MNRDLLIIMAKYPTPGKVKTRLAAEIGQRAAAAVYRELIEDHAREFCDAAFDVEWRYAPARAPFRRIVGNGVTVRAQPVGDLGQRMRRIFAESFARGYRQVVMIGTDCPAMNQRTVRRAFGLLRKFPAVFQPTEDGGYALVGLRREQGRAVKREERRATRDKPNGPWKERTTKRQETTPKLPDIFSGIAWSTERVMAQTRRRLQSRGVSFRELPVTFDVDTAADLARLKKGFR